MKPKIIEGQLSDFTPHTDNLNLGSPEGHAVIRNSLQIAKFGRSLLADKNGNLIAGNQTTEVLVDMGFEDAIVIQHDGSKPVILQRMDLDLYEDEAAQILALADNESTRQGYVPNVRKLLEFANQYPESVSKIIPPDDLDKYRAMLDKLDESSGEDDSTPSSGTGSNDRIRVEPGDVWQLGQHRLLCGDSNDPESIDRVLDGIEPALIWVDPDTDKLEQAVDVWALLSMFECCQVWWDANLYPQLLPPSPHWLVDDSGMNGDCRLAWTNLKGSHNLLRSWKDDGKNAFGLFMKIRQPKSVLTPFFGHKNTLEVANKCGSQWFGIDGDPSACSFLVNWWVGQGGGAERG